MNILILKRSYAVSKCLTRLGRPSNNLSSGIVGLANVGKSTFFQAITDSKLGNPANYPFATIEPEEAKVIVPSKRLDHLQKLYLSSKKIPAVLTIYDIAGLTRGASKGEGLGNKFLNDIRHVDGIFQVVRGFSKVEVTHIEGYVDPTRDLSIVQDELVLKDLEFLEGIREKLERKMSKTAKSSSEYKAMSTEIELLNSLEEHMYEGKKIAHFKSDWTKDEVGILNKHNFLTAKPTMILLNVSPKDYLLQANDYVKDVSGWINENSPGDKLILFSAEFETIYNQFAAVNDFVGLDKYCRSLVEGAGSKFSVRSCLPELIVEMRKSLGLISFFTCGPLEARQWTLREGSLAPQAAGVIHTDLEKTFISANILKFADLKDMAPPLKESQLKAQALVKRGGKLYAMEDGDVVLFKAAKGNSR
ncbi:LANO_0D04698g1_1 [Lachancea nothofagi CBS 11611]|uniref:Obg-like ATPase homolog n=1 Tax=Lachancea nothofagi CBS 11611 TaxID=1266666 RepID=A0A1G4JGX8_9SACH|nr:LANO_0D04698g1_1 [Lachancea nothofagi CBS 11611]